MFSDDTSLDDIVLAGELALCCLYGSRSGEGLNALRFRCFIEKVTKGTTSVQLHQPPLVPSITAHACISKFMSGWEVGQIGPRKMGMAPNTGSTWTTNNIFTTCSRRYLESRQVPMQNRWWYANVRVGPYMQESRVGVFSCMRRMQRN